MGCPETKFKNLGIFSRSILSHRVQSYGAFSSQFVSQVAVVASPAVLAAAIAVALVPDAFAGEKEDNIAAFKAAGFTLVNEDCADKELFNELSCYSSNNPIFLTANEGDVYGLTYEDILRANPDIEDFLVGEYLPAKHWIATREPTAD
jgi:hypothetical protein